MKLGFRKLLPSLRSGNDSQPVETEEFEESAATKPGSLNDIMEEIGDLFHQMNSDAAATMTDAAAVVEDLLSPQFGREPDDDDAETTWTDEDLSAAGYDAEDREENGYYDEYYVDDSVYDDDDFAYTDETDYGDEISADETPPAGVLNASQRPLPAKTPALSPAQAAYTDADTPFTAAEPEEARYTDNDSYAKAEPESRYADNGDSYAEPEEARFADDDDSYAGTEPETRYTDSAEFYADEDPDVRYAGDDELHADEDYEIAGLNLELEGDASTEAPGFVSTPLLDFEDEDFLRQTADNAALPAVENDFIPAAKPNRRHHTEDRLPLTLEEEPHPQTPASQSAAAQPKRRRLKKDTPVSALDEYFLTGENDEEPVLSMAAPAELPRRRRESSPMLTLEEELRPQKRNAEPPQVVQNQTTLPRRRREDAPAKEPRPRKLGAETQAAHNAATPRRRRDDALRLSLEEEFTPKSHTDTPHEPALPPATAKNSALRLSLDEEFVPENYAEMPHELALPPATAKNGAPRLSLDEEFIPEDRDDSMDELAIPAAATRTTVVNASAAEPEEESPYSFDEEADFWASYTPVVLPETPEGEFAEDDALTPLDAEPAVAFTAEDDVVTANDDLLESDEYAEDYAEDAPEAEVSDQGDTAVKLDGNRGGMCLFCGYPLTAGKKYCQNCAAPVKPKRVFHGWVTFQRNLLDPDAADRNNPNLTPCRHCGRPVYRRAHVCPKCGIQLLKPVYPEDEAAASATAANKRPPRQRPRGI